MAGLPICAAHPSLKEDRLLELTVEEQTTAEICSKSNLWQKANWKREYLWKSPEKMERAREEQAKQQVYHMAGEMQF